MCGFMDVSKIGKSLCNVGLFDEGTAVQSFDGLNSALEYCENELLKTFYLKRDALDRQHRRPPVPKLIGMHSIPLVWFTIDLCIDVPLSHSSNVLEEAFFSSPRRDQLSMVAAATLEEHQESTQQLTWLAHEQPLKLILQTFLGLTEKDEGFWQRSVPFFERRSYAAGTILYSSGDTPDGFYLLETGILIAKYRLAQGTSFSEVILAGSTCGELPFLSSTPRTSTTLAECDSIVWVLDNHKWSAIQNQNPELVQELLIVGLKLTSERMTTITSYMLLTNM